MYFGPLPAFLRIPLNFIYPAGRGKWSRISGFAAGVVALFAFAGLIGQSLRSSALQSRARNWLGNACVAAFALATPLLFLVGNVSIYNEAILWGFASSLGALFFACYSRTVEGPALTRSLLGFSFCAGAAFLSRFTFGLPLLFIAPLLALRLPRENRWTRLAALALPLAAGLAFHLLLSYAKFGNLLGVSYEHSINSTHRDFAFHHGIFNLERVPYSFADYFNLYPPRFDNAPPFVWTGRHPYSYPSYFSLPFSETYLSVPWTSSWLLVGAVVGIVFLFLPNRSDWFQRWIAAALLAQCIGILSYHALAQRYAVELYPLLIFSLLVFLQSSATILHRLQYLIIGLVPVSIVINLLATSSFLGRDGWYLPDETRAFWDMIGGRNLF
jgi:hypothetical protein